MECFKTVLIPKFQNLSSKTFFHHLIYIYFYVFIAFTHYKQFSSSLSTMGQTPSCLPSYCRHAHIQTNRCQNLANIMLSLNKWIKHCSSNFCCAVEWIFFLFFLHTYLFSLCHSYNHHIHTSVHIMSTFPLTSLYLTCVLSHALLRPPPCDREH